VRYLRILVLIFVILSAVVGLSIQEVTQPESTISESTKIVEAGGKIIDVELSDGVTGTLGPDKIGLLLEKANEPEDHMDLDFEEFFRAR